jgi:hypothetical protein
LREKLYGDFDILLLSNTVNIDPKRSQKVELLSEEVSIEVMFSFLEGGGEVTLLKDGSVVSRLNFEHYGKDVYLGLRGDKMAIYVNGQEIFQESLGVNKQRWSLVLDSGKIDAKHAWERAFWRLR